MRDRYIQDTRIHCALYFIAPSGQALKPIDIIVMKKLSEVVNVVPVIAKSDSLTLEERDLFKQRVSLSKMRRRLRSNACFRSERSWNTTTSACTPLTARTTSPRRLNSTQLSEYVDDEALVSPHASDESAEHDPVCHCRLRT
jgi:hypothetical protein